MENLFKELIKNNGKPKAKEIGKQIYDNFDLEDVAKEINKDDNIDYASWYILPYYGNNYKDMVKLSKLLDFDKETSEGSVGEILIFEIPGLIKDYDIETILYLTKYYHTDPSILSYSYKFNDCYTILRHIIQYNSG